MFVEFAFGDTAVESKGTLDTGLPLLSGDSREYIERSVEPAGTESGIALWRGADHLVGFARSDPSVPIEEATRRIYDGLLASAREFNLFRIWNLVPRINEESTGGLENYRAFCRGRSVAFEDALGKGFMTSLPAASALGTVAPCLTIAFLAGKAPATHFENPAQVPAYEYPAEHGPRPPSFARATTVDAHGKLDAFISGTSAVVGHETFAPNDTARQLDCTFENLMLISNACGLGPHIGAGHGVARHFKVYLRHASDLSLVTPRMERAILRPGDRVTYLGADICRAALNVEIEVSVRGAERI
jgi:chorismate lyase / 3-hydroxybenzoate synthase